MRKQLKKQIKKQLKKPTKKSFDKIALYGAEGRNWT